MRCSVCDYSDDTPSILNDGLTDGNSPRQFKGRGNDVICDRCFDHVQEVEEAWKLKEYDETGEVSILLDPAWDGALDKL